MSHLSSLVSSVSTDELVLPRRSCCVFATTDTIFRQTLISLELAEVKILMQRLRSSDPGHLSSHSALSSHGHCAAHFFATPFLSTTSGPNPGKLPCF